VNIVYEIVDALPRTFVGKRVRMNRIEDRTAELWRSFMPAKREMQNSRNADLIAMTVYDSPSDLMQFDPKVHFEKWAVVEVGDTNSIPSQMEHFDFRGGLYAVFKYKGSSQDHTVFQYIFGEWLPESIYMLDNRPHLEILGSKYKNGSPDSEEDIWIPIILRTSN
jgi:AraC family transcriptional regulator